MKNKLQNIANFLFVFDRLRILVISNKAKKIEAILNPFCSQENQNKIYTLTRSEAREAIKGIRVDIVITDDPLYKKEKMLTEVMLPYLRANFVVIDGQPVDPSHLNPRFKPFMYFYPDEEVYV